jgi:hypothetical protein
MRKNGLPGITVKSDGLRGSDLHDHQRVGRHSQLVLFAVPLVSLGQDQLLDS